MAPEENIAAARHYHGWVFNEDTRHPFDRGAPSGR
jgi:hypothetical protein